MTPEQHAAQRALVAASEFSTHHPDVYPARMPRGTDSKRTSCDIASGAALAAAVAYVLSQSKQH